MLLEDWLLLLEEVLVLLWNEMEDWRSLGVSLLFNCDCCCHEEDGPGLLLLLEEEAPPPAYAELLEVATGMALGGPEARMGRKEGDPLGVTVPVPCCCMLALTLPSKLELWLWCCC